MLIIDDLNLPPGSRVHLMGVGGIGMSALAAILAQRGYVVTGSDRVESSRLDDLRALGVQINVPQVAGAAGDADLVVISTAIQERNPELADARARGLPVRHRSELLAALVRGLTKVAVSGTHGKTTTTAMLATILLECGHDPTVIVGGDAVNLGGNYHLGTEAVAVFEACESDASFLRYGPCSEIVTSVEPDHLDQHGDFATLCGVFEQFIDLVPADGFLAYDADCDVLAHMATRVRGERVSYGLQRDVLFGAYDLELQRFAARFELRVEGRPVGPVTLAVPGEHNVRNALGAIAAATRLGVDAADAAGALARFRGVGRRFELLGSLRGASVVDDYAHHPTEISATLTAARHGWPEHRIIAIFQPHLFSRTRDFMDDFARALTGADVIIVADIYAAREDPLPGVSAADLARRTAALAPGRDVRFVAEKEEIERLVRALARPDDLIITLGAGDIRRVAEELVE